MVKLAPFRYTSAALNLAANDPRGIVLPHIINCYDNSGEILRSHYSFFLLPVDIEILSYLLLLLLFSQVDTLLHNLATGTSRPHVDTKIMPI